MTSQKKNAALNCVLIFCTSAGFSLSAALGIALAWRTYNHEVASEAYEKKIRALEEERDSWRRDFFQLDYEFTKMAQYNYRLGSELEELRTRGGDK